MEAIGTLAGGIAHDFNNILTAINGYAELALLRMEPKNPLFKEMTGILKAGKRAGSLVRQLLAFSRKQMIELRFVNVNQLIVDLNKMLRRLIGEDIHVEMNLNPALSKIKADPGQIEQILVNLVVNARDAVNMQTETASGKKITVETDNVILDRLFTRNHPGSQPGEHICITVSDSGIGMDETTKSKIFEPFFTTKDKIQGTGLGLATVYGIVKQNNGSIYVYSEPGKGTTIRIFWPVVQEPESDPEQDRVPVDLKGGEETLLYVEDNSDVRDFTVDALKLMGYQVLSAENGRAAIKLLKENNKNIDLLITDVIMPEMGGKELAEYFKKYNGDARILFTSGYTDHHIVHSGTLDDGIFFLHKPYTIESLSVKIREVLRAP
jgi:CheY-like chemotaxis protein